MIRRLLAAACLLLAGCGSNDIYCRIDPSFNADETAAIRRAGDDWNAFATARVRFTDDATADVFIIVKAETPDGFNGHEEGAHRLIRIRPEVVDPELTYAVALHEIGHALLLQHVHRGVMDPDHITVEFSDEDRAECRRVGSCE